MDPRSGSVNLETFFARFPRADFRTMIDWSRLRDDNCVLSIEVTSTRDRLGQLQTPWYVSPFGSLGDWRNPDDRRVRIHEISPRAHFPSVAATEKIANARSTYDEREHVNLDLPCYAVGKSDQLLLDRTHRATALYQANCNFTARIVSIKGPPDPAVLPDLLHDQERVSGENWAKIVASHDHPRRTVSGEG